MRTLEQLLKHCEASGWSMLCYYDNPHEPDYSGTDAAKAKEALEACDEMYVRILDPASHEHIGIAHIINDADGDPEEQIANYGGSRLDAWMKEGEDA